MFPGSMLSRFKYSSEYRQAIISISSKMSNPQSFSHIRFFNAAGFHTRIHAVFCLFGEKVYRQSICALRCIGVHSIPFSFRAIWRVILLSLFHTYSALPNRINIFRISKKAALRLAKQLHEYQNAQHSTLRNAFHVHFFLIKLRLSRAMKKGWQEMSCHPPFSILFYACPRQRRRNILRTTGDGNSISARVMSLSFLKSGRSPISRYASRAFCRSPFIR